MERDRIGRFAKNLNVGEKHPRWKGNNVGYMALHSWVSRCRGRPKKCDWCGTINKKRYHWANLSGEYKRDLSDFVRLCYSCHMKYDLSRLTPEQWESRKKKYHYKKGNIPSTKQFNYKRCLVCGKSVRVIQARWYKFKYCSRKCQFDAQKGKPTWNKGKKGLQVAWNKGKIGIYSKETRKRMGAKNKGIHRSPNTEFKKGEKSRRW